MANVPPVNSPVFSLAGSQSSPRGTVPPSFEDPVPLGVRLYSIVNPVERWVTKWVDDIQFRSVVPGGFASATITLRIPRHQALPSPDARGFSELTELFRRVQIVDLRTMEIAWEGRIEDPARQVDPDTWQIGALGSMVAATDIQRPVFYIDSSVDNWATAWLIWTDGTFHYSPLYENWSTNKDTAKRWLTATFSPGYIFAPPVDPSTNDPNNADYFWRWDSHGYDQPIARFTTTHDGIGSTGSATAAVVIGVAENWQVDNTAFSSSETTKVNKIGTDFTDTNTRYVVIGTTSNSGTYTVSNTDQIQVVVKNPIIVAMRQDRFGNKLTDSTNYGNNYVTVAQVVEDVVGRFLVGGWYELGLNTPLPGSVRPQDVYIDSSNTTQILQLTYPDGATAADILNDLVNQVQSNAYWAIWESKWGASDPTHDFSTNSGFRFEFATWPNNWGYLASSQDGYEGQPNGDDVRNFVFYRYQDNGDGNQWHCSTTWADSSTMVPELLYGGFTRAVTVNKQDPTDANTAGLLGNAYRDSVNTVLNAGTITIRRPITLYDAGQNSASGASRTVDPWMIRPGKLIRVVDLPPRAMERDASSGTMLPAPSINGTLFKVVATEYSSRDNSCRLELDQVTRWQVPTQISSVGGGSKTIRIQ